MSDSGVVNFYPEVIERGIRHCLVYQRFAVAEADFENAIRLSPVDCVEIQRRRGKVDPKTRPKAR
jgi:hypothetical protein